MSCETGGGSQEDKTPQGVERPTTHVDVHRAARELERWLEIDLDAPRGDQHGYEVATPEHRDPLPSNWRETAEKVMTIIYFRDESGKIIDIKYELAQEESSK